MNDRFRVSDKDLVFWQEGMDEVLLKFLKSNYQLPKSIFSKPTNAIRPSGGITLGCLYDNIVNRRTMPCYAGNQIVHIAPNGDIYPCNFKLSEDRIIGNLRKNDFDTIWENINPQILKEIRNCECMYPNGLCGDSDIYPSLRNNPFFVSKWYLKKLFSKKPLIQIHK